MNNLLKLHNLMARATDEYTVFEKKTMYNILNYYQTLGNSEVIGENELEFKMSVTKFKKIINNSHKSNSEIEEAIKGIMKKPLIFLEGNKKIFFTPIPTVILNKEDQEITMELHKDCMKYISHKIKGQFYFADLTKIEKLSSPQAIKMYELLESQRKGKKGFIAITIENLKKVFNISDRYKETEIKTKIIEKSLNKIKKIIPEFEYKVTYFKNGRAWNRITISYNLPSLEKKQNSKSINVTEHLSKAFNEFENTGELNINYKKVINQLDRIEDPNGFKKIERELGEDAAGYIELPNTREWLVERIEFGTGECIDEQLENKIMNM